MLARETPPPARNLQQARASANVASCLKLAGMLRPGKVPLLQSQTAATAEQLVVLVSSAREGSSRLFNVSPDFSFSDFVCFPENLNKSGHQSARAGSRHMPATFRAHLGRIHFPPSAF